MQPIEFIGPRRRARIISTVTSRGHWEGTHAHHGKPAYMRLDLVGRKVAYHIRYDAMENSGLIGTVAEALHTMEAWLSPRRPKRHNDNRHLFAHEDDLT